MLKKRRQSSLGLIIVVLLGFAFSFTVFLHPQLFAKANPASPTIKNDPTILGGPVRLRIPKINVNAAIEYVGLTPAGAMDVPKGPAEVAWFKLGPRPGEVGNAVIAGHSGWKNGPAVFDYLSKIKKGDKIYVDDGKGGTISFVVREIRTYSPNQDASDVFGSSDGIAHLNLITCTGFWNSILKSHSDRLIVFTDRE